MIRNPRYCIVEHNVYILVVYPVVQTVIHATTLLDGLIRTPICRSRIITFVLVVRTPSSVETMNILRHPQKIRVSVRCDP
jgi:hypothetical protein